MDWNDDGESSACGDELDCSDAERIHDDAEAPRDGDDAAESD
jgi:hypothetical protein